jgi:hypothetical protein
MCLCQSLKVCLVITKMRNVYDKHLLILAIHSYFTYNKQILKFQGSSFLIERPFRNLLNNGEEICKTKFFIVTNYSIKEFH